MSDYIDPHDQHEETEEQVPRKRFRLFDSQREGRGVTKEDKPITPDLCGFFRSFRRNFSKLLSVNLLTVVGNFPLLFAILALTGLFKVQYMTPAGGYFADLRAMMLLDGALDPATMALFGVQGVQIENSAMTTTSYVFFGLSLLTFLTFGFVKVGTTYIIRSLVRGEPAFMIADFKYAIKRNKKQAFFYGMVDLLLLLLIPFNIIVLLETTGNLLTSIIFWFNVVFAILYLFMRPYIYLQMITFDLKITKIIKNSFLFALLGAKRNIMALLGNILLFGLVFFFIFGIGGALLFLGIALPLVALFSFGSYMHAFAAWYKIKEIMIDPQGLDEDAPPELSEAEAE